ncbi:KdsC family phosphatase [Mesohalobacter halotolerans]|uniref:HAD-IIIA family hydrolase n=1 Tax=Mesohalobacter halotolerans TaxID=1883405 RepID=A0A4U5TQ96_9FLAO|nr:HAD-IIIA family hydrolase [Mesohalobacter halotolerans]MBS3739375.1 HAD-IIIA family hydrolase [Psychroflexus sp.]TKS56357.1 HAD-IIIA family hydrolase [Mesohalobacter halotolerans]
MSDKNYKQILNDIKAFVFDVDGVLTDGKLHISESGELLRQMNVKDGYAMKQAIKKGYEICIISGGNNPAVKSRLKTLGITNIYLGVDDKMEKLDEFSDIYNVSFKNMCYMGDDIPDMEVMQEVALAACPQNAVPEIKVISQYVSHRNGGDACVRDIIEQVMKVQHNWI